MPERDCRRPATTAEIGEHPIHAMLIPCPTALLVAALVASGLIGSAAAVIVLLYTGLKSGAPVCRRRIRMQTEVRTALGAALHRAANA